jgi:hypothetical protein
MVDRMLTGRLALHRTLNLLPCAVEAPFNSYYSQHENTCLENTRVDVLQEISHWVDGQGKQCIFWLNGLAGTGKSTISRTISRRYFEQGRLGASFFFSRGGGDVSHAGKFFTSIAMQLMDNAPPLQRCICKAIMEYRDIASQSLRDQWHQLILHPLSKLNGRAHHLSYILVVDALDECESEKDIKAILQLLAEARLLTTVRLRIFLTSRPEIPIRHGFSQISGSEHQDFVLHHISPAIVDHDISIFLEHHLGIIRQECYLDAGWPGKQAIRCLVQHASGLFIWAATAYRFILDGKRFAPRRLNTILERSSASTIVPEKHLDEIYITVLEQFLKQSISLAFTDKEIEESYDLLRHTLGCIVSLLSPLSANSLTRILNITKQDMDQILDSLHAILDIPKDRTIPIRLHHPSFRDFLLNKNRCNNPKLWVDKKQAHQRLADNCVQLMSISLKQDICGVDAPGFLVTDIERGQVEQCFPLEVQYACLYWVQHLQKSDAQIYDDDHIHQFLQTHLLHWFEALGWMRKVSEGIRAIICLRSIASVSSY